MLDYCLALFRQTVPKAVKRHPSRTQRRFVPLYLGCWCNASFSELIFIITSISSNESHTRSTNLTPYLHT